MINNHQVFCIKNKKQMAEKKLTYKQEAFAQAYMRTGEKSTAYREVYKCDKMKSNVINIKAQQVFNNGNVLVRVQELQKEAEKIAKEKFGVTSEEILRHLNILRKARIDEYVRLEYEMVDSGQKDDNDEPIMEERPVVFFKAFSELTEEQLMCIESIKQTRYGIELKLHGVEWTIEKINKHIGFYEKDNFQKAGELSSIERSELLNKILEKTKK